MTRETPETRPLSRRDFIRKIMRRLLVAVLGLAWIERFMKASPGRAVWQIDPSKCVKCGRCATACVLTPSAVKCVHEYGICGYCNLCFGYFQPGASRLTEDAENQLCPTGAIQRRFVEEPFFEYRIDESKCIGCGKCVEGCNLFGNGSLYLQVRHDRCRNCNDCRIARECAGNAFVRLPADKPFFRKRK